jgi:glycosyltransferase involved in cell wall biosynthesis
MIKKPETLVIFTPAFPVNEADEIWLPWLQALVKALNRNFSSTKVIIFSFQAPHSVAVYTWHNNLVIPFNGMHKKRFARVVMWGNIVNKLGKIKNSHNVKGIFSMWCHECAYVAKKAAKLYRLKHFCWLLGGDAGISNPYIKKIQPLASELVAASDFLQNEFHRNHEVKPAHVIYHGIDTSLFDLMPTHKDIDIIGVGNLHALKQYDLFVEIVAELKKSFPAIKVFLCGEGEERVRLEKMIAHLSLGENIKMTGMMQHTDVLKMMQRAKILLHPSSYEGFGTVCTEALYAGAYVVSFCKPLNTDVKNWHIAKTREEMLIIALSLLEKDKPEHNRILVQGINNTAIQVMKLFNQDQYILRARQ